MAKKEKPPVESAPLKHSPFAALRRAGAQPVQAAPEPQRATDGESAGLAEPRPDERATVSGAEPRAAPPGAHGRSAAAGAEVAPSQRSVSAGSEPAASSQGKSRGRLVQRRETKHRAGKAVVIVSGFEELRDFDVSALEALAKELKQALGCGGTLEARAGRRELVLQGDRPAQVAALLRARGFRVDGVTR
jgi:translation initiation factor 1 (eIF-1/SUI1)